MTSNWLLAGQVSNVPVFESALPRVVELAATYLVQSTLFLAAGWALLSVVAMLTRRRMPKPDGRTETSPRVNPALTELIWKLSAVLALVTAPLSVFTGWSRPAWEWSLRERPSPVVAVAPRATSHPEPTALTEPLAPAAVRSRPALPEELAVLDNDLPADRLMAGEPTAEFLPFTSVTPLPDNTLDQQTDSEHIVIEPAVIAPSLVDAHAGLYPSRRDTPPASTSNQLADMEPRHTSIHWLGIALVAWFVLSASRLVAKGFALRCRLAAGEPIHGELRHELNRLTPRGRSVRLLRSCPLSPGFVGERARVRGSNGELAGKMEDGTALRSLDERSHESARKNEEPLTLTLSPPRRGERGQEQITEPFACGLLRWTIVLPAGIERELSHAELQALLAHEVAHLVRRDPWWLWLGEVLCTCLAFQPLNLLARRRWQQAAELLCDDWAVEQKVSATSLASCLTRIAEWRLVRRAAVMGLTAVGPAGSLTQRIEWLLRTGRAAEPKRPRGRTLATLLTFAAGLFVGMYGPRLSFVLPAEAHDDSGAVVVLNESALWRDINRDLAETLNELARLDLQLTSDPDPEVASLTNRLRARAAGLSEQLLQPDTAASHAQRAHKSSSTTQTHDSLANH